MTATPRYYAAEDLPKGSSKPVVTKHNVSING